MSEFFTVEKLAIALGILFILDAIVRFTPTKKDDFFFSVLLKIIFRFIPGLKEEWLETRKPPKPPA